MGRAAPLCLALLGILGGCSRQTESHPQATPNLSPPTARPDMVEQLEADMAAARDPSDGGGRAWLEDARAAIASTPGRWSIVYEAGPRGIDPGGALFFQAPPFWGWSTPQVTSPEAPGFTEVTIGAQGPKLEPRTFAPQLLAIEVKGQKLEPGQKVRIVYGAGPAGAIADRYAEHGSRFWIAVDGNADGVRALVRDSPSIEILPGPPAQLHLTLPTTARPGQSVRLTVAVLDASGNAGCEVAGEVVLEDLPPPLHFPERIVLTAGDRGRKTVSGRVRAAGVYRLRAAGPGGLSAESNPMVVSADGARIVWADLQGHSNFSDGTGLPEDYFRYARDVAALDVVALTDHDHWGMEFLDSHPDLWQEIRAQTRRFHDPGRFVTILGYEWTSWIHGHRHVLYFSGRGKVHSSLDPDTETPQQLWTALAGEEAITIAHHSAGGPIAINWSFPPDPALEPVTEIMSVHGSSEAADSPSRIYSAVPGNFVRDALGRGYRLGFVASGDGHDGHPGLSHLAAGRGGLAAIFTEHLTRAAVLSALRARRVYATSGPRIFLRTSLGGVRMGGVLQHTGGPQDLAVKVVGTAPIARVDVIRSGAVVEGLRGEGTRRAAFTRTLTGLEAGEYVYVRVVQEDGSLAWSSPIFVD